MRIGWVIPWLHRTGGNKTVLSLARGLVQSGHDAQLFCHTVRTDIVPEVERQLGGVPFSYLVSSPRAYAGHRDDLSWQLPSGRYRALTASIVDAHRRSPFDAVIVVANEGRQLARQLRKALPEPSPLLGWSIMELIDHTFLLRRERDHPLLRSLLSPLYPAFHWAWGRSMREFDFLCANSPWTAELVDYLYGLDCGHLLISIPEEAYAPGSGLPSPPEPPYIAVPTVSLGSRETRLLGEIGAHGLNLVAFGPRRVPGLQDRGFLPENQMRQLLQGACATLFLFDYEALGLLPFESLAVGTPVVTLPKHGVHAQWRGSPFVGFADRAPDLIEACQRWVNSPPTSTERDAARSSVEPYRASRASAALAAYLAKIQDPRPEAARTPRA